MNANLLRLLQRLALPGARLVWRDYRVFGIAFWSLESEEHYGETTIGRAECVDDAGLIEQLFNPEAGWLTRVSAANDKYVYELSDAGKQALAAAEGETKS